MQSLQFEEKKSTRKFYVDAMAYAEGDKEDPDAEWNKGNNGLSAQLHTANPSTKNVLHLKRKTKQSLCKY